MKELSMEKLKIESPDGTTFSCRVFLDGEEIGGIPELAILISGRSPRILIKFKQDENFIKLSPDGKIEMSEEALNAAKGGNLYVDTEIVLKGLMKVNLE